MKLVSFEITDFKSIRKSTPIEVGDVTCLVGKNESGKTAILQALYKLNPVVSEHATFDVTDEYPRAEVEEYRQQVEDEEIDDATVVQAVYALEHAEIKKVEGVFGLGVLPESRISLSKGYDNKLYVDLKVNQPAAVASFVKSYKLPKDVAQSALACETVKALKEFLDRDGEQRDEEHESAMSEAEGLSDPDAKAIAIHEADLLSESEASKKLRAMLETIVPETLSIYIWKNYLKPSWPKFLYFDEYYQMDGHVNIEKLKERQRSQKLRSPDFPMLGLIDLARLDLDHHRLREPLQTLPRSMAAAMQADPGRTRMPGRSG